MPWTRKVSWRSSHPESAANRLARINAADRRGIVTASLEKGRIVTLDEFVERLPLERKTVSSVYSDSNGRVRKVELSVYAVRLGSIVV